MTWKHWKTGEEWMSESDYIYNILLYSKEYTDKSREGIKRYYSKTKK